MTSVTIGNSVNPGGVTVSPASAATEAAAEATAAAARAEAAVTGEGISERSAMNLIYRSMPVTPNILHDTKLWSKMAGGATNSNVNYRTAHTGSGYSAGSGNGTVSGDIRVITPAMFDGLVSQGGIKPSSDFDAFDGDLESKLGAYTNSESFNILRVTLDIRATGSNTPQAWILAKDFGQFLSQEASEGDFTVYSGGFMRCLAKSGATNIVASPQYLGQGDLGDDWCEHKNWVHYRYTQTGLQFGPRLIVQGAGTLDFLLALPYIGHGDHGNNFVWAGFNGDWAFKDIED